MSRKSKPRPRNPESPKAGMDPVITQVFREADEAITRDYLETKKYLRTAQEHLLAQIKNTFWRDAKFLKKCREEINVSQHDLARATGISPSAIGNYEAGWKPPTVENAYKIYQALNTLGGGIGTVRALVEILSLFETAELAQREMLQGKLESMKANLASMNASSEITDALGKYKARLSEMAIAEAQAGAAKQS